ncbi:sigma-70 family RNA polymerase sigma factor [Kribbella sancticallisti]|uniref:Sigma-70 family RNA polymerase sigma factor n=1 Tax=Kribbella sancticallisti TaxID=460087 RepID=A0ABP4QVC4_9ACTN
MPADLVSPAAGEFARLAEPLRGELLAHCYRVLGSVHDADDAVQETFVRAWQAYDRFDGRSSLRTWLYTIATRACLRALEQSKRRPLPSGIGSATDDPNAPIGAAAGDVPWLEPFPTGRDRADPADVSERKADVRLAFAATLQLLPARQRVALLLREVLDWSAAEIADPLQTTPAGVNSLLQRARATLSQVQAQDVAEPDESSLRCILDIYVRAFEQADVDALRQVLTKDAVWEMPPYATWFTGRHRVVEFLRTRAGSPGDEIMVPTEANGQPAFACYQRSAADSRFEAHAIQVLTVTSAGISSITSFMRPQLFPVFGLPEMLTQTDGAVR